MCNKKQKNVVIIDTGCANISSVDIAIARLGYRAKITDNANLILNADTLVLPGVGSAHQAMKNLKQRNLIQVIRQITQPILGICLGMQLLGLSSAEKNAKTSKNEPCLACLDIETQKMQVSPLPLPHMGWNKISIVDNHPLFHRIANDSYFYFVHSFAMPVSPLTIGLCHYGSTFSAAVQYKNFYGVQFHPERSSQAGALLLNNFLEIR